MPNIKTGRSKRQKSTRRARALTAYHEAGHAVVAWLCGVRITGITIIRTDDARGSCAHENLLRGYSEYDGSDRMRMRIEKLVMIAMAGLTAQRFHRPRGVRYYHATSDYQMAVDLAFSVNGSSEATNAWIKWLEMRTQGMLRRNWLWVTELAKQLLRSGTLNKNEVERVLQSDRILAKARRLL